MTPIRRFILFLAIVLPACATADLSTEDLPGDAVWYVHVNMAELRGADGGRPIYAWFEREVISEVREEIGIDLSEEVERLTAFADNDGGPVIVVEGNISELLAGELLTRVREEADVDERSHRGNTYFQVGDEESNESPVSLERFEDGGFFSFAVEGKIIAAASEDRLKALIDSNGRIAGAAAHADALFVLSADKSLVQAGIRTDEFADDEDDDDWGSEIIRNTEQIALLVSDSAGRIAIEASLKSKTAEMARAIGNIVNGLISLQAFNSEMDSNIRSVLQNTRVDIDDTLLSINTVLEADVLVSILDD